jgi:hypothetical protein
MAPRERNQLNKPAEQHEKSEPTTEEQDRPIEQDQPGEKAPTKDGICVLCWPDGWPTEDTKSANCEHGSWQR